MIEQHAMTETQSLILNHIQSGFPLVEDPYSRIAKELNLPRDAVISTITRLREDGIIRRIGASYVSAKLGYATTLVAAEVEPECIQDAADVASSFAEVTHNYQRNHRLNLWFTVIANSQQWLNSIISIIANTPGVRAVHPLPYQQIFKLKVEFNFNNAPANPATRTRTGKKTPPIIHSSLHKGLIAHSCADIDFTPYPFERLAHSCAMSTAKVLKLLQSYKQQGIMRRFGAILHHQAAGFEGNGMSVWRVPENNIHHAARELASHQQISHCYQRKTTPDWSYNLYAMIHGQDRSEVTTLCHQIAGKIGVNDYQLLFSEREFKKSSMTYFPEHL